jgi:hypothetical protein
MSKNCNSTLANGDPCNAPATNNNSCCRHHDPGRPRESTRARSCQSQPLELPPLTDKHGIFCAVIEVIHAVSQRRIKRSEGGTLLFGLQFASSLMNELNEMAPPNLDQETDTNPDPQLLLDPNKLSADIAKLGETRRKRETEGHVAYTPGPADERELMELFDKGRIEEYLQLFLAKQEAWEKDRTKISAARTEPLRGIQS